MKDINQQEQQLSSGYPGLLSFRLPQLITFNLPNTNTMIANTKHSTNNADTTPLVTTKSDKKTAYQLLSDGSYEQAVDMLIALTNANRDDVEIKRYLAYALAKCGRFNDAAAEYGLLQQANQLNDNDCLMFATSLANASRDVEAIKILSACVDRNPSFTNARLLLIKEDQKVGLRAQASKLAAEGMSRATTARELGIYQDMFCQSETTTLITSSTQRPKTQATRPVTFFSPTNTLARHF
jgi:predicted Zn-dependent protease